ncbi:MAG: UDP-N-acetylmuramoyl-L-alanyl-D-glutamate--2,6-diaminopimelate ligase [Breznakia sp.]
MKLNKIFKDAPAIEIASLHNDSRNKMANGMFFCLDGILTNGHKFIDKAIENGAICIVHSEEIKKHSPDIAYIQVVSVNDTLNQVVAKFYHYPSESLCVFGVTGTNGKSTVTNIIKDIYDHFAPCGYIGTISISYNNVHRSPDLTTPDALMLNNVLADMVADNVKAVALEVSSHGLEQKRVDSIDFDIVAFTNFSYDHIDFHGTMENYFNAKKRLFSLVKESGVSIINHDEECYDALSLESRARIISYGIQKESDYQALNLTLDKTGSSFDLLYENKTYPVKTNLIAMYNIYNLLCAIACVHQSGIPLDNILPYTAHLSQVEGRLEIIDEGQPFNVIVDFAHTPDGLRKIYEYAKMITEDNGDIISVFGSAGRRDKAKRKVFGEIASQYCNYIILTEDDPRDESAKLIAEEIRSGIHENIRTIFIEERYDAIRQAVESANKNDTILILGKGDETFMYRENGRMPWLGDNVAVIDCIKKYYLNNFDIDKNE